VTSKSGPSPKSMIAQHMIADSLLGRGRMISPLVMPSTYKRSYWENRVVRLGWDLGPATHRRRRTVVLRLTYHCDTFHRLWQLTDDLWWRPHCNSIRRLSDKQSAVDPSSTFVPNQVTVTFWQYSFEQFNRSLSDGHYPAETAVAFKESFAKPIVNNWIF